MARKTLELAFLTALVSTSVACGVIETPTILALDEGSAIDITLFPDTPNEFPAATVGLEGGLVSLLTVEIGLFDLLLGLPFEGSVEVTELLFAGEPFELISLPTGAVCTIPQAGSSGPGTVTIDLFDQQANNASVEFMVDLAAAIVVENPTLSGPFPNGLPLSIEVDADADLSLIELLGLIGGNSEGVLTLSQPLSERFSIIFLGVELPIGVDGVLSLTSANAFPTGALLDDCIAFLGL